MNEIQRHFVYETPPEARKCTGCGDEPGSNPLSCHVCQKTIGPEMYKAILDEQTKKAKRFGLKPRK